MIRRHNLFGWALVAAIGALAVVAWVLVVADDMMGGGYVAADD